MQINLIQFKIGELKQCIKGIYDIKLNKSP